MWYGNDWRGNTTDTTGSWEGDDDTICINYTYYEDPKPDTSLFAERLSNDFIPTPVRKLVSLLLGRQVDKHSGGYQRNGKRRAWTGVNFCKVSC